MRAQPLGASDGDAHVDANARVESHANSHRDPKPAWRLDGSLPWITNLRPQGFIVAAAFDNADGAAPSIFAIPHDTPGVLRSADLDLIALRASNTAALRIENARLSHDYLLSSDARTFIHRVRPGFLGLQCGMSIGLAQRSLRAIDAASNASRSALEGEAAALGHRLGTLSAELYEGVTKGSFRDAPATLFELRIALASVVDAAVRLEVQASGGRGYLRGAGGAARRTREAAFIPIVTPSIVQLKNQLHQYAREHTA